MKTLRIAFLFLVGIAVCAVPLWWYISADKNKKAFDESEPDLPPLSIKMIDKEEYHRLRIEYFETFRGFDTAKPDSRPKALKAMERSEVALARRNASINAPEAASWRFLGPAPIPIGASNAYSGRISAVAVHPTNSDIVYVGTAQGGLYRTLNGGAAWTALMDGAQSLAIGAVAISPSDPTTIFVGTGEAGLCGSGCFIGVGVYRITNADTNPVVTGPLNQGTVGGDVFTGRATGEVIIHPTDPNIIFVTTTSGIAGIGSTTSGLVLPNAGLYRSTNAMSATPTFEKIAITGTGAASRSVVDAVAEPGNPSRLIVTVVGSGGDGGVYLTTNALDPVPTFSRTLTTGDGSQLGRAELAVNKTGSVVTVYAATGTVTPPTAAGTLFKSVDGGASFTPTVAGGGFCNPQCFYDIAVAVDPNNAEKVFLGGSPARVMSRSLNGGGTFTANNQTAQTLHVDTQAFALAPSNPSIMYFGSDGGMWKTTNVDATPIVWSTLNNTTFSATQFMGIALHPFDRHYTLGGTQDNGTQFLAPDGTTWVQSDGGDGGFAVIDQNSPSPTILTGAYHTYYNQTNSQIGFSRALTTDTNGDPFWAAFLGCQGTTSNNGINCADQVLFYAPMVGGPGNPNSLYFGTNRLYRSINKGTTMTDVSGVLPFRISAIGISPQNDDIRLVGLTNGSVYLSTTAGATTMTNVTGAIPARYVGRIAIDPTDANVAYVALNGYGLAAGQHVWKTTNLLSGTPTWSPAGGGIPDVPVNTFAIDPANTQVLFAGSDIGVFRSTDGGANWQPFSNGLPRVAVFGMEFHPIHRVLKIATHGRGIYEYDFANTQGTLFDYDGDERSDLSVFRPSDNNWFLLRTTDGFTGFEWGVAGDKIAPADFDGDGKTDVSVWRPSNGTWYRIESDDFTIVTTPWGLNGDVPVPGDFDGDGKADLAVFRPSDNKWYRRHSSDDSFVTTEFGISGDKPVVGDFDGDGMNDLVVYRPSENKWFLLQTTAGFTGFNWGLPGDLIAPADFDGDGKVDVAVWRPSEGKWYWINSSDLSLSSKVWGLSGDIPIPADYSGDGKADFAVFRPSESKWYIFTSTSEISIQEFGITGDVPTQSAFIQ